MKKSSISAGALSFALLGAMLAPAQAALVNRALVSATGADAPNCGATAATACRTFQYIVTNIIAPGGEIDVMSAGGYGPVTIVHSLSIVNDEAGAAGMGAVAGGNSITINAGPADNIFLKGLTGDGFGVGSNGVAFNTGGSLTIDKCVFKNYHYSGSGNNSGNGILLQPISGTINFSISNTITSNNGLVGVSYYPPSGSPVVIGAIDRLISTNNQSGISIDSSF